MKRSLAMLALLLLPGCEQGPHFVALDLRTDLVVSREADTLEIVVDDGEPMEIELESGENYLDGARVLELAMLEPVGEGPAALASGAESGPGPSPASSWSAGAPPS